MKTRTATLFGLLLLTTACERDYMTTAEALHALDQTAASARGEQATNEPIEISTDFTIGAALEAAAEQFAAFWDSQQDCTTTTIEGATVTIDFGELDDDCDFQGHHYGGVAQVTVDSTDPGELQVTHDWFELNNGDVRVDGGAVVDWSGNDQTRHVYTEHTWTDLADGTEVDVVGDHIQGWIDEDLRLWGGITMEGTRDWTSEEGDWHIDMNNLEIRLQDPVAQAGQIALTDPEGRTLTLEHERLDERTIRITLEGTRQPLVFDINQLGIPTEVDDR
jgi:hypothetical protein